MNVILFSHIPLRVYAASSCPFAHFAIKFSESEISLFAFLLFLKANGNFYFLFFAAVFRLQKYFIKICLVCQDFS